MKITEKRVLCLKADGNINSTNDLIELFLSNPIFDNFKHLLESLYCLNWAQKLFVSSFQNDENTDSSTRDVIHYILKNGLQFKNSKDEFFTLKSMEPEPDTYQISLFFVNPETTDQVIQEYVNDNKWGSLHKIVRHTYQRYNNIQNGFVTLFMKEYHSNVIPEKCYINGRRISVKTPETRKNRLCYVCHKSGHLAKDCTVPKNCNICDKPGHQQSTCPNLGKECPQEELETIQMVNQSYSQVVTTPVKTQSTLNENGHAMNIERKSPKKNDTNSDGKESSKQSLSLGDFLSKDGKLSQSRKRKKNKPRKTKIPLKVKYNEENLIDLFQTDAAEKKRLTSERTTRNSSEASNPAPSKKANNEDSGSSDYDTGTDDVLIIDEKSDEAT